MLCAPSHITIVYLTYLDGTPRCCAKNLLTGRKVNSNGGKDDTINAATEVIICHVNEVMLTRVATKVHGVRHIGEEFR